VHRRQRREDDVAHAGSGEQPVGERGAVAHRAPRRHLIDDVVHAGDDDRDVGAERSGADEQIVDASGRQPGASSQRPFDAPSGRALQCSHEVADDRLLLARDADAGGRRITGDEQTQRRCARGTDDAFAFAVRLGKHRRPAPRRQRLGDEQRRERDFERQRGGRRRDALRARRRSGAAGAVRSARSRACASRRRH
jgi:hypothetical protein